MLDVAYLSTSVNVEDKRNDTSASHCIVRLQQEYSVQIYLPQYRKDTEH